MLSRSHAGGALLRHARRFLLLLLATLVGAMGLLPVASPASAATVPGLEGDGSAADPLVIDSVADLDAAANAVVTDATTYGALSYRLDADIDYAGGTFGGFGNFAGAFDGNGHSISNLVYSNANNAVGFFRTLNGATVTGLTLRNATGTTATGDASAGLIAVEATNSTISGNSILDSSVRLGAGGLVNTQSGGVVGTAIGTTVISDNLLWNVAVQGHKYAGGITAYPRTGPVRLARNLLVDVRVFSDAGGSGATAGLLMSQGGVGIDVTGNVVHRGSVSRSGSGVAAVGPVAMTGTAPNLVSTSTEIKAGSVAGATAVLGALDPVAEPSLPNLITQSTYEGLGWDFTAGTGGWLWNDDAQHPVPTRVALPSYAITYDLAGGEAATANPTSYGIGAAITLVNPTRNGYAFAGWTGTGITAATTTVTIPIGSAGDRAYVATWAPVVYAVSYDLAGGTVVGTNPETYHLESDAFTLVNPTREGYTFAGWTGTGLAGPATEVTVASGSTGDLSYVATWSAPLDFALSYDLAGGAVAGANPATYHLESDAFTLVNPAREGYTFAGWTGTGLAGPVMEVTVASGSTGDRAYVATWAAVEYAITYDLAGGTIADGNRAAYDIESGAFTLVNPTRVGHTFAGWTGTGLSSPTIDVTVATGASGHRAYVASWTAISYQLSYELDGGSVTGNPVAYAADSAAITLVNPTRAGHLFAGWVGTDLDGPTLVVTIESGEMGHRSYVATWTAVTVVKGKSSLSLAVIKRDNGKALRKPKQARVTLRLPAGDAAATGTVRIVAKATIVKGTRKIKVTRIRTVVAKPGQVVVKLPSGLKVGTWLVTASYSGDSAHLGSTAKAVKLRITKQRQK